MMNRMAKLKQIGNVVAFTMVLALTACSEAKEYEVRGASDDCKIENAIVIPEVNCEIPDLVLSPLNVPETGIKGFANENWMEDKAIANFGDVSERIERCLDNKFHICVSNPIPLILPKELSHKIKFEIDGSLYIFETAERLDGKNTCNLKNLQFKITNEQKHEYVFSISKREGLLHYSLRTPDKLGDTEVYRILGKMFSYKDFCQSDP